MPIFEYQCGGCGKTFEVLQKRDDPAPKKHEDCGSKKVKRIMSASAFVFKGEGWYITDYSRKDKEKKANEKKSKKKGGSDGGSSEGGSSSGGDKGGSDKSSGSKTSAA